MLPKAISYNNIIYKTVGMIKMNDGAFLIAKNENKLINFDFTRLANLLSNLKIEIKKPSIIENNFMIFIQNKIQDKINNGELNSDIEINYAFTDINRYINTTQGLLINLKNIGSQSNLNNESLNNYFDNLMSGNKYFKKTTPKDDLATLPKYDEQLVTTILSTPQSANFDIDKFIKKYYNNFNLEQIDLLLTKFQLHESQIKNLEDKKNSLISDTTNSNLKSSLGKRKTFALPGIKESKEAAFIDTLLLSFTVGIFCGIYLMYFVLTIMS